MRGSDMRTGELFSYVDLEKRVPEHHPLRLIRRIVNEVLADLDREFAELYAAEGRPSIAPERLLRALLLHVNRRRIGTPDRHPKGTRRGPSGRRAGTRRRAPSGSELIRTNGCLVTDQPTQIHSPVNRRSQDAI